ncbi:hypothetical protein CP557_02130 [Natrinema ejinorense]|uniref:Uncharacterized protein n=1 Tax=Natrinema ejinorense TaxID=373386 RepID=A0A2A5QRG6_9EURY|nr:hypothetical protein CP557_02130 [Natrinema ejinorense]
MLKRDGAACFSPESKSLSRVLYDTSWPKLTEFPCCLEASIDCFCCFVLCPFGCISCRQSAGSRINSFDPALGSLSDYLINWWSFDSYARNGRHVVCRFRGD